MIDVQRMVWDAKTGTFVDVDAEVISMMPRRMTDEGFCIMPPCITPDACAAQQRCAQRRRP